MSKLRITLISAILFLTSVLGDGDLSYDFKGQFSLTHASALSGPFEASPSTFRYIPQLRFDQQPGDLQRVGLDAAMDIYGHALGDSLTRTNAELYRFTLRYDTPEVQYRVGLQKINFGPARLLRVLQWFDQLDPRDPLALSPGVWAALGRRYFENGMNLRLWAMADAPEMNREYWGNQDHWPWDLGGRLEYPLPAGTLGLSLNTMDVTGASPVKENRLAGDVRVDRVVGLWTEVMLARVSDPEYEEDTFSIMGGVDYTFGIGNGLYTALEVLTSHRGARGSEMPWQVRTLAITGNYTLGLEDGLVFYLYAVDHPVLDSKIIPMLGWQHTRGNWLLYLALYDMPEFMGGSVLALPAGRGIQVNVAFNH